ncbi:hypothetical protein KI387_031637, partial [Taxus chinensis]
VPRFSLLEDLVMGLVEVEAKGVGAEVVGIAEGDENEGKVVSVVVMGTEGEEIGVAAVV